MRGLGMALVVMLAAAWGPAAAQGPEATLAAGWQRVDAHTLRRVDIPVAAAQWQRVDAQRWRRLEPGEAPRAVASR